MFSLLLKELIFIFIYSSKGILFVCNIESFSAHTKWNATNKAADTKRIYHIQRWWNVIEVLILLFADIVSLFIISCLLERHHLNETIIGAPPLKITR